MIRNRVLFFETKFTFTIYIHLIVGLLIVNYYLVLSVPKGPKAPKVEIRCSPAPHLLCS